MLLLVSVLLALWAPWAQGQDKPCQFPEIKHGRLFTEDRYRLDFKVRGRKQFLYICDDDYVTPSESSWDYIVCKANGWSPKVPCRRKCVFNKLEHGYYPVDEETYFQGQSTKVTCHPGYSLENQQDTLTCTENGWSPPPRCVLTSKTKHCNMPIFENARAVIMGKPFGPNDTLDYQCLDGYENRDGSTAGSMVCGEGGWSRLPTCFKSAEKCGPPPAVSNGDITSFPLAEYLPSSRVEYQCQAYYELQGPRYVTCSSGKWSKPPRCIDPCVISENHMNENNIQLKGKDDKTYYVKTGDTVGFSCKPGHRAATPEQSFEVACVEGTVKLPRCE